MNPFSSAKSRQNEAPVRRRLYCLAVVTLAGITLFASGCGTTTHPGGDPGNKRLNELSHDPIFSALPPGATNVHISRSPAEYVDVPFQGSHWNGPSVEVTFRSSAPVSDVYRFYAQRAKVTGWRPWLRGGLGLDRWKKTYPDEATAYFSIKLLSPESILKRRYSLGGGI
jgi:hypothetical protein